ncbi:MAG: O-antigen ligase family protein [Oscillospiraceae bacterium]|nr:O-antigen ligase family protein [Oscillospiraceae bacterium]
MTGVILTAAVTAVMGVAGYFLLRRREICTATRALMWLNFVLPFAFGGFYTYFALPLTAFLLAVLLRTVKQNGELRLKTNLSTVAILLVVLGYLVTPLWAADQGMAAFGMIRMLPLLLYLLLLLQIPAEERSGVLTLVPLSGAVMTLLSMALLLIPELGTYMTISDRLAGFFAYPNTFAVFALAGLLLVMLKQEKKWQDYLTGGILVLGVIASGSRTAFVFLGVAAVLLLIPKGRGKMAAFAAVAVAAGIGLSFLLAGFEPLSGADRFTTIDVSESTFLGRLLYYKDALTMILRHPFGTGYWGWRVLQSGVQTGVYAVTFVHNSLLQLFLDIGWVPAIAVAIAFLKTIFSKKTSYTARAVLLVVLGHCLLDFDLEYLSIWLILIPLLPTDDGKEKVLKKPRTPVLAVGSVMLALCLWLGTGDFLVQMGWSEACLSVTPFHTDSLEKQLYGETDMAKLAKTADKMLRLCPTSSIAHSAKANVAFSRGEALLMMEEKELAIANARYTLVEYIDYLDKLFALYQAYSQMGDAGSAEFCARKILEVPGMMDSVIDSTAALAYRIADVPELTLPAEYLQAIEDIKAIYGA